MNDHKNTRNTRIWRRTPRPPNGLYVGFSYSTRLDSYTGITWPFKGLPATQRPRNALRRTRCARTRSPWRPGLLHVLSNELPSVRIGLQRLDVLPPSCRQLTRLVLRAALLHDLNLTHEHTTQLARLTDPRANYLRMD